MGVTIGPGNTLIVSAPGPQGPAGAGGAGGVSDGDKGDITISSSGTVYTIDNDAVTFAKVQNITGPALVGRQAATSGDVEAITLGSGLTIDGSKQLSISASYAQQSVTMTAGTGLTGGGDLSANRTFAVAYGSTASTACVGNDARLSDARDPNEHTHYAPQQYVGHIETPTARTYYVDLYTPALLITSLRFKTSSGTVDVTLLNGASQVYTADGLGTTRTDVTTGLTNASVSAGGTISLVVDAVSTPADLQFVIAYTAATGGIE